MELQLEVGKVYLNGLKQKTKIKHTYKHGGRMLYVGVTESGDTEGNQYNQVFEEDGKILNENLVRGYSLKQEYKEPYKVVKYFAKTDDDFEDDVNERLKTLDLSYFTLEDSVGKLLKYWNYEGGGVNQVFRVTVESVDDLTNDNV